MIEPMKSFPKDFRKDIAGLRALAVMLVLLNHFQIPGFGFGFIGVDIFFVISGFLITRVLYKDFVFSNLENPGKSFLSLSNFYLRRIRRLLPAAFAVIILVNIASFFLYNTESKSNLQTDSKWALLFLANIAFLRNQSDYFQQNTEPSMLLHYWSLSVEEQFYFVWPILFLVAASLHRMKLRGLYFRFDKRILALILLISALSFAFLQYGSANTPTAAYFSIFTRAWELGVGAFFGILAFHKRAELRFSSFELYSLLSVSIFISAVVINDTNWAKYVVIPVLATGFFLYAGQGKSSNELIGPPVLQPVRRTTQFLGKISYSLYLVHWPIFVIFDRLDLLENTLVRLCLIPISVAGGFLLWKYIEIPFQNIRLPKRFKWDESIFHFVKARRALIGALSLSLVGSLYLVTYPEIPRQLLASKGDISGLANEIALQRFAEFEGELLSGNSINSTVPSNSSETPTASLGLDLKSLESEVVSNLRKGLQVTSLNETLAIKFKTLKGDASAFELSGCPSQDSEVARDCKVGNRSPSAKGVALIGDSKMAHFVEPLSKYFVERGWFVEPLVMYGCTPSNPNNKFMEYCVDRSQWILSKLSQTKFDLVIFAEFPGVGKRDYFQTIQDSAKEVIILRTNPSTTKPTQCITPSLQFDKSCQTIPKNFLPTLMNTYQFLDSLKSPNTYVIEAEKWVCVEFDCPYIVGDIFITRDGSHITNSYVRQITPLIFATLDAIKNW
jgi:peptidoglycan/LPS O-acetylase OafA/YrhL